MYCSRPRKDSSLSTFPKIDSPSKKYSYITGYFIMPFQNYSLPGWNKKKLLLLSILHFQNLPEQTLLFPVTLSVSRSISSQISLKSVTFCKGKESRKFKNMDCGCNNSVQHMHVQMYFKIELPHRYKTPSYVILPCITKSLIAKLVLSTVFGFVSFHFFFRGEQGGGGGLFFFLCPLSKI